jgi:signal transduction histidine kinase
VRLGRDNRIHWSSPAARAVLGISAADAGHPVSEFSSPLLSGSLISDMREVLKSMASKEAEVKTASGGLYLRRTLPYRLDGNDVDGVLMTVTDITEFKHVAGQALAGQAAQALLFEQRVIERTAQLRQLTFELATAEERERRAIALDLHDHLGQLLAVANVKLGAHHKDGNISDAVCAEVCDLMQRAERTVRSLAFQVSPPVLYELGLVPALEWLADEMRGVYGLEVTVRDDGKPKPLDKAIRSIVFRVVRELLIDVSKHAKVGTAAIDLRGGDGGIELSVSDAGVGFDPTALAAPGARGGFGLPSVRERVAAIGGEFEIESVHGDGTVAKLRVPFEPGPQPAPMFAP